MNHSRITAAALAAVLTFAQAAAPVSSLSRGVFDTPFSASAAAQSGTYGDQISWRFENGMLTVSGTGEMADTTPAPWLTLAEEITALKIGEGVTQIADEAFMGCTALAAVSLPESLLEIGARAFAGCTSLEAMIVDHNVISLGAGAFENCTALDRAGIGRGVTCVPEDTFAGCTALRLVTLTGGALETIGARAFAGCTTLARMAFPAGVSEVGALVFDGCTGLESLYLPASVTSVAADALHGCDSALTVTCPPDTDVPALFDGTAISCVASQTDAQKGTTLSARSDQAAQSLEYDFSALGASDAVTAISFDLLCDAGLTLNLLQTGADRFDFSVAAQVTNYRVTLGTPLYAAKPTCTFALSAHAPQQTDTTGFACVSNIHFYNAAGTEVFPTAVRQLSEARGDINGDTRVDVNDAIQILKAVSDELLGKPSALTDAQQRAADINRDGTIKISDAILVLRYYAANMLRPTDWEAL